MGGVRRDRGVRWTVALALLLGAAGCRSPIVQEDGLYRHRQLGYAIGRPPEPEGYWSFADLERTDVAFRGRGGETLSLATRCRAPLAEPRILARHLRFGLPENSVRRAGEITIAGRPAWMQVFEIPGGGGPVSVKTVTFVVRECIFDFLLAARSRFEEAERTFDAWLRTLRLGEGAR